MNITKQAVGLLMGFAAISAVADENLSFYISNHDQSPGHRVIHPIVGQTNFVYDAKGAWEYVSGEAIAFYVKDCQNVTIRNLHLDWERPTITEAKIVGFDGDDTIVEIDHRHWPVTLIDGRLAAVGAGYTNLTEYCMIFDGGTRELIPEAGDVAYNGAARALIDDRYLLKRDFRRFGEGAKVGDVVAMRPVKRDFPAIVIDSSEGVVLEDVAVHDAKGMALIAQRSKDITWRGSRNAAAKTSGVFPRPGSYASAHADASHFSNVGGSVVVENCWFEGMMDDAINIHSTCLAITNVVAANRIRCRFMHSQAIGFELFRAGETLRLINGGTLENGPELKVVAVERHDEREITITLATPLPTGWGAGDAVENADYQCAATFRGNVICNNRARGTLFTTPKPVLVESNLFNKVTGSPLLFAGDNYFWYESGACRNVTIRGNVFSNCCTAASRHGYSKGILSFYPIVRDFERQQARYHGNILVEDNEFCGFDVPLLFAISTENVVWRRNHVVYNDLHRGWEEPPFVFKHCRNIEIDGRQVAGDTRIDTASRRELEFNDGWEFRKEPTTTWRSVTLPHDWAIESEFDPNGEPGAGRLPYAGTGWYRKRFALDASATGQSVFLDVGGAMTESDVYLNGVLVGGRKYGFSSYRVNLTAAIKSPGEENLLEIRCHVPAKSARFDFGAGIYRPLKLVLTAPVHVGYRGVFVTTDLQKDGSAKVNAQVDVKGPLAFVNAGARNTFAWGDVRVVNRVLGEDGMIIRRPKLWSPESPSLYTLETVLTYDGKPVDRVLTRFGVRTIEHRPHDGLFLNGKYRPTTMGHCCALAMTNGMAQATDIFGANENDCSLEVTLASPDVKVVYEGNRAVLNVNGERIEPNVNHDWSACAQGYAFDEKIYQLGFRIADCGLWVSGNVEREDGSYDFSSLDRAAEAILKRLPDAYLYLNVWFAFPKWCAKHPDDIIQYADGKAGEGNTDERLGRPIRPSAASSAFRAEVARFVKSMGEHVNAQPWGKQVALVRPSWGVYAEWHYWGMYHYPDVSKSMADAFHKWDGGKWRGAALPTVEERNVGGWLDPVKDAKTIDYYRCMAEVTSDFLLFCCHEMRRAFPGRLVGAYYGYVMASHPPEGATVMLEKVLSSPDVDFLVNPSMYTIGSRRAGGAYYHRTIPASFQRHGKLALIEDDMRFHHIRHTLKTSSELAICTETPRETQMTMRRNYVNRLFDGAGMQINDPMSNSFGQRPHSYDDPTVFAGIREAQAVVAKAGRQGMDSGNEVALVVDPMMRLKVSSKPRNFCGGRIFAALEFAYRTGVAFDMLTEDDLKAKRRQYRHVVRLADLVDNPPFSVTEWRKLFDSVGAEAIAESDNYVRRHGNLILFHTATSGKHTITPPVDLSGRAATELFTGKRYAGERFAVTTDGCDTLLFQFHR